jgi:hypothetical protein
VLGEGGVVVYGEANWVEQAPRDRCLFMPCDQASGVGEGARRVGVIKRAEPVGDLRHWVIIELTIDAD